uniref:Amino acid transporter n=1 Tax=Anopheles epiroticus TaxID=199890 RepID=A0A182PHU4_9DIPT
MSRKGKVSFFLTETGRQVVFYGATTVAIGLFAGHYFPHSICISYYREFVQAYKNGEERKLSEKLEQRYKRALNLLDLTEFEKKFAKPFVVYGFDVFNAGSFKTRYGAYVGIPSNFEYDSVASIDRTDIKIRNQPIDWSSEAGRLLEDALVLSEDEQVFGIARELLTMKTHKSLIQSIIPTVSWMFTYSLASQLNERCNFYARPRSLRLILYTICGLFGFGIYSFSTDMTEIYYETDVDKQMATLGPDVVDAGARFYDKVLKKNIAIRKLTGEDYYTAKGNVNYMIRQKAAPLTLRKEFFQTGYKDYVGAEETTIPLSRFHSSTNYANMKVTWKSVWGFVRRNLLTTLTILGVIVGIALGLGLRAVTAEGESWSQRDVTYINYVGDLFLRTLKALILPLIVSSLIAAVGSLDLSLSKKIGGRAVLYYLATTVLAVILGIVLVVTIKPGSDREGGEVEADGVPQRNVTTVDTLLDLVRNMFPPNLVQACTQQYQTVLKPPVSNPDESDIYRWTITGAYADGMNILGLVVASIVFGVALGATKRENALVLQFFQQLSHIVMKVTGWVIWLSPVGVTFLIAAKILEIEDLGDVFGKLGLYFAVVAGGILFHGFVVLSLLFFLFTRNNPLKFIANMGQALATAFGTSSSSASLPVTMQCLEEKNNIDPRVSRFVLPIGATINMDGTALYEAVAAIFIAQLRGLSLSFGNVLAISITATAASIGAAGIPQAGLVTLVMVLDTVGLPAEDVSLIIAVDWLLDRFRTLVNVLGDSFGAAIVYHYSKSELQHTKSLEGGLSATTHLSQDTTDPELAYHTDTVLANGDERAVDKNSRL